MAKNLKENKKKGFVRKAITAYNIFSIVYMVYAFMKSRGAGKEDDRHLIGKAIDRISGYDIDADSIITIDETDLHVSYNPYMHLLTNNIGSIAYVLNGTTEVYIDNTFRQLSKNTQRFVLSHELGHYKCGHKADCKYILNRTKAILNGKVLDIEVEADEFAADIIKKSYIEMYEKKYGDIVNHDNIYDIYDIYDKINKMAVKTVINSLEELSSHSSGLTKREFKLRAKLFRDFALKKKGPKKEILRQRIFLCYSKEYKKELS